MLSLHRSPTPTSILPPPFSPPLPCHRFDLFSGCLPMILIAGEINRIIFVSEHYLFSTAWYHYSHLFESFVVVPFSIQRCYIAHIDVVRMFDYYYCGCTTDHHCSCSCSSFFHIKKHITHINSLTIVYSNWWLGSIAIARTQLIWLINEIHRLVYGCVRVLFVLFCAYLPYACEFAYRTMQIFALIFWWIVKFHGRNKNKK